MKKTNDSVVMIEVITIYDNNEYDNKFQTDWGFGCIVNHPYARILFDTGAKPQILQANLKAASISPESIDIVVISHKHCDHTGGALWLAQQNPNISIYMPKTWVKNFDVKIANCATKIHCIEKNFSIDDASLYLIVFKNLLITELVLVIKTLSGAIIFTGYSHTGIVHIIKTIQNMTKSNICGVFGGFHLFRSSMKNIHNTVAKLKKMKVKNVAPCHCTGRNATVILEKEFSENFLVNDVGTKISYSK